MLLVFQLTLTSLLFKTNSFWIAIHHDSLSYQNRTTSFLYQSRAYRWKYNLNHSFIKVHLLQIGPLLLQIGTQSAQELFCVWSWKCQLHPFLLLCSTEFLSAELTFYCHANRIIILNLYHQLLQIPYLITSSYLLLQKHIPNIL